MAHFAVGAMATRRQRFEIQMPFCVAMVFYRGTSMAATTASPKRHDPFDSLPCHSALRGGPDECHIFLKKLEMVKSVQTIFPELAGIRDGRQILSWENQSFQFNRKIALKPRLIRPLAHHDLKRIDIIRRQGRLPVF